jgi:hypothetical protein
VYRPLLVLAFGLSACKGTATVAIQVTAPDVNGAAVPAADLALVALPYDRDSVITSLEARAGSPRPSTALLDSAFAEFRTPFAAFSTVSYAMQALQDSLRAATDPTVRSRLEADIAEHKAEIARLRPAIESARARLSLRSDSARVGVRAWEDIAFEGYDTAVKRLAGLRQPVADTTDAVGRASVTLKPGQWWITAHAWDASDPNSEWYWNVKIEGDSVVLTPANARRMPRY